MRYSNSAKGGDVKWDFCCHICADFSLNAEMNFCITELYPLLHQKKENQQVLLGDKCNLD